MKPLIEIENMKKFYKQKRTNIFEKPSFVKAVNGISLTLYEGEAFGLVGESGCGKSTIGQLIIQLMKQTDGTIRYKGKDVSTFSTKQLKAWRQEVQIVFQDPYSSLNPKKTIKWILNEPLALHRIGDKAYRNEKIIQTLKEVGLDPSFLYRYPHELSGGQRQRVAIAAAIILEPRFIVIDEGVSALDVSVQAQIINLLKELQEKYSLTYLFISHDLNIVQYFCDRIAVMYMGEIVEHGTTEEIRAYPKHPYTQALFSAIPTIGNKQSSTKLKGDLPDTSDPPCGCTFHPRCPHAFERCKFEKPSTVTISKGHEAACHLMKLEKGK